MLMRALDSIRHELAVHEPRVAELKGVRDEYVWRLLELGWPERDIAEIAGLSRARVHQIREASRSGGRFVDGGTVTLPLRKRPDNDDDPVPTPESKVESLMQQLADSVAEAKRSAAEIRTEPVRMAMRDASWWANPNTRSPKVYHVIISPPYVAACGAQVMLDPESECSVESAHIGLRCRRRGCLNRWGGTR